MAISIIKTPKDIHSAGNTNYWVFQSDLRFAPRFNLRANIIELPSNALVNSLLLPTSPNQSSIMDISYILPDFIDRDPKPLITSATHSNQAIDYRIEISESFQGLYIFGSSSAGTIQNFQVINNETVFNIGTPSNITDIGFIGGLVQTPIDEIVVFNYTTSSTTGLIDSIELSRSPTQSIAPTASIGVSFGYLVLQEIGINSIGATTSTGTYSAILADIDYLPWQEDNDFNGFIIGNSNSQFLTTLKSQTIQTNEYSTLSFIQGATQAAIAEIIDNTGATYSYNINIPNKKRIDIPSGTDNLNIPSDRTSYSIQLKNGSGNIISEKIVYNIKQGSQRGTACLPQSSNINPLAANVRVLWLNDIGGWDYYTFKWVEQKSRVVERETFEKNLVYGSTKRDRVLTSYKVKDHQQWELVSDIVSEETSNWISSLFTTKEAYLIWNNDYYPIQIITDSHIVSLGWDNSEVRATIRLSRGNIK